MRIIGLKLWSTDLNYITFVRDMFARKIFDYIELFTVPGSLETIALWEELDIPFVLHAPHSATGFNPSDPSRRVDNLELVRQVNEFFLVLSPGMVIFHPGVNGKIEESLEQFGIFKDRFPQLFKNALIENKPKIGLNKAVCLGAAPDEINRLMDETGLGFCFDIGHAICYAVWAGRPWKKAVEEFLEFSPHMFHLSDGYYSPNDAHEHLGVGEFDLPYLLGLIPQGKHITVETKKDFADSLQDFLQDVKKLKGYDGF